MTDISTVENALVDTLANALLGSSSYVPGTITPSTIMVAGSPVSLCIYRDWPNPQELEDDLKKGRVHVTVYAMPNMSRLTTRFASTWQPMDAPAPTLGVTVAANTVTITGSGDAGQVVGIGYGHTGWSYRITGPMTAAAVAAALTALVPGATVSGAKITLPTTLTALAQVGADRTMARELRRQSQRFMVSIWAPTPAHRDAVGAKLTTAMAALTGLTLADGVRTPMPLARGVSQPQSAEKVGTFRRDEQYEIEYPTIETAIHTPVLFIGVAGINTNTALAGVFTSAGPYSTTI